MHCDVSTLPATTAAGGTGSSIDPGGTTICSGRRQPAFSGMGSAISVRKTYRTAAIVTARGALKLLACCGEVPVKSTRRRAGCAVHVDAHDDRLAVVEFVAEAAVPQLADGAPDAALGVVLHVLHVCEHRAAAVLGLRAVEFARAPRVRSQLRAQVGEVLREVPGGPRPAAQQLVHECLVEDRVAHDASRRNERAFLGDVATAGRHRARRDAADVGVVRARSREEFDACAPSAPNTGDTTVMSGRCVPPAYGELTRNASPLRMSAAYSSSTAATLAPMEPRCTGMCGALATRLASASKIAHEKSRRSLMLIELAVCRSTAPICSATCMNSALKTSSRIGSGASGAAPAASACATAAAVRRRASQRPASRSAASEPRQPGAIQLVAPASHSSSGPVHCHAGAQIRPASSNGTSCHAPSMPDTRRRAALERRRRASTACASRRWLPARPRSRRLPP